MKITIQESDYCFWFEMEAETVADAAQLVRMKTNAKKVPGDLHVHATEKGSVQGNLQVMTRKDKTSYVQGKQ